MFRIPSDCAGLSAQAQVTRPLALPIRPESAVRWRRPLRSAAVARASRALDGRVLEREMWLELELAGASGSQP